MKPLILSILLFSGLFTRSQVNSIRIACIGNSITYGSKLDDRLHDAYPAQLQTLLGRNYNVMNFGVSGATLLKQGNNPYTQTPQYQQALKSRPDIVFIKLGTNDSKGINRVFLDQFKADYLELVRSFQQLDSKPRVILLLPVPAFTTDTAQIWDAVITKQIIPKIQELAFEHKLEIIDLHPLLVDKPAMFPDKVHPDENGATVIANRLFEAVLGNLDSSFNIFHHLPSPQVQTSFYGYDCADFTFAGRNCKVVKPRRSAFNHPWVWRARFWGHEPQADIALLERGFHVVYCDVVELYGNRESVDIWNRFYTLLHEAGLAVKVSMEGLSRGGVYVYNWAAENPEKVACVYVDNAVLDLRSWPGGKGKGPGSKADWEIFKKDYGVTSEEEAVAVAASPLDKVAAIAKGKYPMLHLTADSDEAVPVEENTNPFAEKIRALGGDITVIYKRGFRHHPHALPDPTPIVDFILKATNQVQQ